MFQEKKIALNTDNVYKRNINIYVNIIVKTHMEYFTFVFVIIITMYIFKTYIFN